MVGGHPLFPLSLLVLVSVLLPSLHQVYMQCGQLHLDFPFVIFPQWQRWCSLHLHFFMSFSLSLLSPFYFPLLIIYPSSSCCSCSSFPQQNIAKWQFYFLGDFFYCAFCWGGWDVYACHWFLISFCNDLSLIINVTQWQVSCCAKVWVVTMMWWNKSSGKTWLIFWETYKKTALYIAITCWLFMWIVMKKCHITSIIKWTVNISSSRGIFGILPWQPSKIKMMMMEVIIM